MRQQNARVAQLVERDLAKVEAAGSSPVSRSLKKYGNVENTAFPFFNFWIILNHTGILSSKAFEISFRNP